MLTSGNLDGIHWMLVTLNGFGNPLNYGIRRLFSVGNALLYVGTANPFTSNLGGGCEVLEGIKIPSQVIPQISIGTLSTFTV